MKLKHYKLYLWIIGLLGSFDLLDSKPMHSILGPACLPQGCNENTINSGPICVIDDSGLPKTFDNRCMISLEYCNYGIYFAELRPGEC